MLFLKDIFEKVNLKKQSQTTKKHAKLSSMQKVKWINYLVYMKSIGQWDMSDTM